MSPLNNKQKSKILALAASFAALGASVGVDVESALADPKANLSEEHLKQLQLKFQAAAAASYKGAASAQGKVESKQIKIDSQQYKVTSQQHKVESKQFKLSNQQYKVENEQFKVEIEGLKNASNSSQKVQKVKTFR